MQGLRLTAAPEAPRLRDWESIDRWQALNNSGWRVTWLWRHSLSPECCSEQRPPFLLASSPLAFRDWS
jgi:hypothetical protein